MAEDRAARSDWATWRIRFGDLVYLELILSGPHRTDATPEQLIALGTLLQRLGKAFARIQKTLPRIPGEGPK